MGMVQRSVFCNQFNSLTHTQPDRYFFFKFEYTSWVNHSIVCIRPVSDKNRVFVSVSYEFSGYPMAWPILSISSTAHEALHQIRTRNSDKSTVVRTGSGLMDWWWFRWINFWGFGDHQPFNNHSEPFINHHYCWDPFLAIHQPWKSTIFGMIPIGRSPPSWDGIPIDGSMDLFFFFEVWRILVLIET